MPVGYSNKTGLPLTPPSRKGVILSEEHKRKIRKSLIGHSVSEITREKISISGIGRKNPHTEKWNKLIGNSQKKEKHHNWKGGITILQRAIRNLLEIKTWRKSVWLKDNFSCVFCGYKSTGRRPSDIHADHIKSFSIILKENNIKTVEEAINCKELWDINK